MVGPLSGFEVRDWSAGRIAQGVPDGATVFSDASIREVDVEFLSGAVLPVNPAGTGGASFAIA